MFFYKRYVCKHLVGIVIIQKKIITRPAAKNQPLGIKRGKGRPPMAKLVLVRMMHESILDYENLSSEVHLIIKRNEEENLLVLRLKLLELLLS